MVESGYTGHFRNFISIQQAHTVQGKGYHQPYIRTGYEAVIPYRVTSMFAVAAKQDGKVVSIASEGLIVEYADGSQLGVKLGRRFGNAEGSTYPHDIVANVRENEVFKKGKTLAYNTGFFEEDHLNPGGIIWKSSLAVSTALYESYQTHEDSSAISVAVSQKLSTKTTKIRPFVVELGQGVRNIVKVGQTVQPNDVLFLLEDVATADTSMFDSDTLSTLKRLSTNAPKAKYKGTVDRILVLYHGDKEDMSSSLRTLANQSDKTLATEAKAIGEPVHTGSVSADYRVSGKPLILNTAEIQIFITVDDRSGVGDKGVFGPQLKTVHGEVLPDNVLTEFGDVIGGVFGYRSIAARIVTSTLNVGMNTTLLIKGSKNALKIYNGEGID